MTFRAVCTSAAIFFCLSLFLGAEYDQGLQEQIKEIQGHFPILKPEYFHDMSIVARKADDGGGCFGKNSCAAIFLATMNFSTKTLPLAAPADGIKPPRTEDCMVQRLRANQMGNFVTKMEQSVVAGPPDAKPKVSHGMDWRWK